MIDVESEVFTTVANALRDAYPDIFVTPEYVPKPSTFPAVIIEEMDSSVYTRTSDSANLENHAEVMYQIDIFSALVQGRKAECKAIAATADEQFAKMGFARTYLNPVPNMNDATIYRITGRYRAVVSKDQIIYRR